MAHESASGGAAATKKKPGRKPRASGAADASSGAMKDTTAPNWSADSETMTFTSGGLEITVRRTDQQNTSNGARSGTSGKAKSRGS